MDPYRKAPKIETFKRSWLRKKLRKFRIRFLTFFMENYEEFVVWVAINEFHQDGPKWIIRVSYVVANADN